LDCLSEPRIEEGKNEPVAVGAERIDQADLKPRARIGDVDQTELHALQFIRPVQRTDLDPATAHGIIEQKGELRNHT